jgi:hypothetical protein
VTPILKKLLHSYGLLYVTIMTLQNERPGTPHATLRDYYDSLGEAEPGEPILAVHISPDGQTRFLRQNANQLPPDLKSRYENGDVTIMELPEDEFYFFQAFRPGAFDLETQLPPFILQMALVYAYTLFENYIADVIRLRLHAHPAQIGLKKQITVAELLASESRESLIASEIEREVNQIMYMPIVAILNSLRSRFGLRDLSTEHDRSIEVLSLTRNCIVHNGGKVDSRLAATNTSLVVGQSIEMGTEALSNFIHACRKVCASVDLALESLNGT